MSRRSLFALASLWAALLPLPPARAAARLELAGSATPVALEIRVTNAGDAPATAVAPEAGYQHQTLRGEPVDLAPAAAHTWSLALPASSGPGTFPVLVRVAYTEARDTTSLPLVVLVQVPMATPATVRTSLQTVPGPGFAATRLRVENPGAHPLAGRVAFVLPSVLHTEPETEPVQVAAGAERMLPVSVTSRGARADASYAFYAVLEYEDDGVHHTVVARTDVRAGSAAPARALPLAIGALALTGALGVLALAWRSAARRRVLAV